jgi:hypothetical protein
VNDAVDLVGRHAGGHGLEGLVQNLAAELASDAKIWDRCYDF